MAEDHPRGCGENAVITCISGAGIGSPPRMRGKPFSFCCFFLNRGITPADAGKTGQCASDYPRKGDHPRGCGENCRQVVARRLRLGSPPQVRGKLNLSCSLLGVTRITPAGAGKTAYRAIRDICARDHPRRCGENFADSSVMRSSDGSPPQVRGKRSRSVFACSIARITPAGAGKTLQLAVDNSQE